MKLTVRNYDTNKDYEFDNIESITPDFLNCELLITCSTNFVSESDFERIFGNWVLNVGSFNKEIFAQICFPTSCSMQIDE